MASSGLLKSHRISSPATQRSKNFSKMYFHLQSHMDEQKTPHRYERMSWNTIVRPSSKNAWQLGVEGQRGGKGLRRHHSVHQSEVQTSDGMGKIVHQVVRHMGWENYMESTTYRRFQQNVRFIGIQLLRDQIPGADHARINAPSSLIQSAETLGSTRHRTQIYTYVQNTLTVHQSTHHAFEHTHTHTHVYIFKHSYIYKPNLHARKTRKTPRILTKVGFQHTHKQKHTPCWGERNDFYPHKIHDFTTTPLPSLQ